MTDAGRHPTSILTLAEIEQIGGCRQLQGRVKQRLRSMREKDCTACGDC
jgi:heterodisulfide reductase subunit A-like polyferredoxin